MKKEDLIRKLDTVRTPDLLVASHRERLRKLLLEGDLSQQLTSKESAGSKGWGLNGFGDWLRLPAWRAAAASALALIGVGIILALVFYVIAPSPAVIAEDVVRKDPGIQQRLGGTGEIIIVQVQVRDGMASVVCGRSVGDFIEADVDINGRSVVNTRKFEAVYMPELTPSAQEKAVAIASSDTRVKGMLDRGGTVGKIFPIYSSFSNVTVVNGNLLKMTSAATLAVVPVQLNGRTWLVEVNLEQGRMEHIIEPQLWQVIKIYYVQTNL